MKSTMNTLTVAGTLLSGVWVHAVSLDLWPATSSANLDDPVQVEVRISGLGGGTAPSLGAYDFTLAFNPAVLGFGAFTFGDSLLGNQLDLVGFGTVAGFDGGTPGQLSVFEISLDLAGDLDALQAASFALGTISFNALGNGSSVLEFTSAVLSDAGGNPLTVRLGSGSISVPEPISGGITVAGAVLFALAAQHLKRKRM